MISAIVQSNQTRKDFIIHQIFGRKPNVVGIYISIVIKEGSDNFRKSAVFDIIDKLVKSNVKVIVYEPILKTVDNNFVKVDCLKTFKSLCDLIMTNRNDKNLLDVEYKVYTRDIFKKD